MLHKLKSTYGEIAKYFPELGGKISSADHKKQLLLGMARGKQRPNIKTPLGMALSNYTRKSSSVYDSAFDRKIKKLAPDWFVSQAKKADQKKRTLIKMARRGESKPPKNTSLGAAFSHYSLKSSDVYDSKFYNDIKKICPDWLMSTSEIKKRRLLEMTSKARPNRKTSLGMSLSSYTSKSHNSYDPIFAKKIKKLAPHWFRKCSTN
jgi:hypothetical protein